MAGKSGSPHCPTVAQADGFRAPHLRRASTVSLYTSINVVLCFSGVSVNIAGTARPCEQLAFYIDKDFNAHDTFIGFNLSRKSRID